MPADYVLFEVDLAWAFHDVFDPTLAPPMTMTIRDADPSAHQRKIHHQGSGETGPKHAILEKGRAYEVTLSGYTDPFEIRGSGSINWSDEAHPHHLFENDPGNPVAYYFSRDNQAFAVYDEQRWRGKELLAGPVEVIT